MLAKYIFVIGLITAIAVFGSERAGKAGVPAITSISPLSPVVPIVPVMPRRRLLAPVLPAQPEPELERRNVNGSIVKRT